MFLIDPKLVYPPKYKNSLPTKLIAREIIVVFAPVTIAYVANLIIWVVECTNKSAIRYMPPVIVDITYLLLNQRWLKGEKMTTQTPVIEPVYGAF